MAVGNNISKPVTYIDRTTGKSVTITPASQGGYMSAYNDYVARKEDALKQYETDLDTTLAQNNQTTNANYDNSARQAYVQYMQRQRALPSQLQALGVRGGATESGLLNLYNNYGSTHAANEQQRNADLTTNQQNRNDAYNTYRRAWQEDLDNQYQTALSNQMNEYNNEITRFSSSVAQYPSTKSGYEAYKKWADAMAASDDPLKDIKVALIRQQMATQFPNGKPSGGSGGGGGGRSYGGGGSGSRSGSSSSSKSLAKAAYTELANTPARAVAAAFSIGSKPQGWKRSNNTGGGGRSW